MSICVDFLVERRGFEPLTSAVQRARHFQRRVHVLPRLLHRSLAARWPAAADPPVRGSERAFLAATHLLTLLRGRPEPGRGGRSRHVVDYRHVAISSIRSPRAKPGALVGLAYRDTLWALPAFARAWDPLITRLPEKKDCHTTAHGNRVC
jgi:hypothetical protein